MPERREPNFNATFISAEQLKAARQLAGVAENTPEEAEAIRKAAEEARVVAVLKEQERDAAKERDLLRQIAETQSDPATHVRMDLEKLIPAAAAQAKAAAEREEFQAAPTQVIQRPKKRQGFWKRLFGNK